MIKVLLPLYTLSVELMVMHSKVKGVKKWQNPVHVVVECPLFSTLFRIISFFNSFQGSDEFVKRFLLPDILRKYDQSDIGGTFIVDTLMNLNLTENRSSSCHPIRRNHKPMKRGDYVIFSMQTLSM